MTLVELGLKRGKVPWVPITPTPDPGITGRLIQGTRSVARINLVRLIVQFQFCLSPPCRVETRRRCIGVAAKRLFSFTRLSFLFPSVIFFFFFGSFPFAVSGKNDDGVRTMRETRAKRTKPKGRGRGRRAQAARKGCFSSATKGSVNYRKAASSRKAVAKAAVGSQGDPRVYGGLRASRAFCSGENARRSSFCWLTRDVGQNFRLRIQSRTASLLFRVLFVILAAVHQSQPLARSCSSIPSMTA